MDSSAIARYLDETYPERKLFRGSAKSLEAQFEFIQIAVKMVSNMEGLRGLVLPWIPKGLNASSAEYYRRTRSALFGKSLDDIVPEASDEEAACWENVAKAFDALFQLIKKSEEQNIDLLWALDEAGDLAPTYTGLVFAGALAFIQRAGREGTGQRIATYNDGFWEQFQRDVAKHVKCL